MQDINVLKNSYLIIGGPHSKKSEVSSILSKELNLKLINLDREKYSYFDDFTDFDSSKYYKLIETKGELKALNYIHKYEMLHLNNVLDNLNFNAIIDFGNTYLIINDEKVLNKVKLFKNIILLVIDNDKINKLNDLDRKLYNNKILNDIATIKIKVENKTIDDIIKEIKNYISFKDIL